MSYMYQKIVCNLTSLNANGKPKTPAPMNDMKIFDMILTGLFEPGPPPPAATVIVKNRL